MFKLTDQYKKKIFIGYFSILLISIPFSMDVSIGSSQLNVPSEPLIAILVILILLFFDFRSFFTSSFFRHPITLAGLAFQSWMILMIPFSSDPMVSFKYTLVNASHYWGFYVGYYFLFTNTGNQILTWIRYYSVSFLGIIVYFLIRFSFYHFRMDMALIMPQPFFSDHALFSAVTVFLIPFCLLDIKRHGRWSLYQLFMICLFIAAIYFSYSRATWLSGVVAILITLSLLAKIHKYVLLVFGATVTLSIGILFLFLLLPQGPQHNYEEIQKKNWADQIRSITDFKRDVSNLERINRYRCAYRMSKERPLTGFGPGTFQNAFLSFQRPEEMTRISVTTNRAPNGLPHPTGRGGGAHSEFFQALAELGWPGLLAWMALMATSMFTGLKLYYRPCLQRKYLIIALIASLATYFTHSLLNNFLHNEEISILFWSTLACVTILDLHPITLPSEKHDVI